MGVKQGNFHHKPLNYRPPAIGRNRNPLRICMIEPGVEHGSIGCQFVMNAARSAGFAVEYIEPGDKREWDIELVSIHHCTDFSPLAKLPRKAPVRIIGGHPTVNNIRPAIPFGDVFCIGEGEEWIVWVLDMLARGADTSDLSQVPGTIVTALHEYGGAIPKSLTVFPLPKHPPYLNRQTRGHSRTWYIEMARGCPFACAYCELGNAWAYRLQDTDYLLWQVDQCVREQSRKITLFAPDEASHPGYSEVLKRLQSRRLETSYGSMRLDVVMRKALPLKKNMLIRVGIDGLTEATRYRVGRKISDDAIVDYFRFMSERGHVQFKIFMVFCYPWDTLDDFHEWAVLMKRIKAIPRTKNANVRIKFTPFIPQPPTPLGSCPPSYNDELIHAATEWFEENRTPKTYPGWYFVSDGIMSRRSHDEQCRLTLGDELTLDSSWRGR